ncbi:hypothetical protein CYY_009577 [Polysphondylium violaceum]|uniref:Pentacotripeptide-repeat region of PRORP domain-containing protein n=1 Tax=Polysphondylium violaceum TaxID=133409 RepID=A0A8J4UVW2_9MYCE|nr:hypothetical protein CYY_009577 [Polysphondylium violaceum]
MTSLSYQSKSISRLISILKHRHQLCTYYSSNSSSSSNLENGKRIRSDPIRFARDNQDKTTEEQSNQLTEYKTTATIQTTKDKQDSNQIQHLTKELQEKAKHLPSTSSPLSDPTKSALYDMMNYQKVNPIIGKRKKHLYDFNTSSVDPIVFFSQNPLSPKLVIDFIKRMGISEHPERILETIQYLDRNGFECNQFIYTTAMTGLAQNGDLENTLAIFKRMIRQGIKANNHSFNPILIAYSKVGDIDEALRQLQVMENKYHILPDHVNYTTLLNGCVLNKQYSKAVQLFSEARHKGMQPDSVTLSVMIDACAKDDRVEKAFTYYEEFKYLNLPPTEVTFNSLINACAKRADNEYYLKAFELLQEMSLYNYQADILTYTSLLNAASKRGEVSVAEKIYKDILTNDSLKHKVRDERVFTLMIGTYANNQLDVKKNLPGPALKKNIEKAEAVFKDMKRFKIPISKYPMDQFLKVYAYAGHLHLTQQIFDDYPKIGLKHDNNSYGIMIRMYVSHKRFEKALELLRRMRAEEIIPDRYIYLTLLHGTARVGYAKTCVKLAREMADLGYPPESDELKGIMKRFESYPTIVEELKSIYIISETKDDYFDRNMVFNQ